MRTSLMSFCAIVAVCTGCGTAWSTYRIGDRIQEIREDASAPQAVQSAPAAAGREIVVAVPSGVVFLAYFDEQKGIYDRTEPIEVWGPRGAVEETKEFADSQRAAYTARTGRKTARYICAFPDFGVGIEEALARRAGATGPRIVVRTDEAARESADVVISLVQFTFDPMPPKKPKRGSVAIGVQVRTNDRQQFEKGSGISSGAGHLAWAIPAMVATFPASLVWVTPILQVIKQNNEAEGLALSVDQAMDDVFAVVVAAAARAEEQPATTSPAEQPAPAAGGCTSDTDCAGDGICEDGDCTKPKAKTKPKR